jgi:hypothetical protein
MLSFFEFKVQIINWIQKREDRGIFLLAVWIDSRWPVAQEKIVRNPSWVQFEGIGYLTIENYSFYFRFCGWSRVIFGVRDCC